MNPLSLLKQYAKLEKQRIALLAKSNEFSTKHYDAVKKQSDILCQIMKERSRGLDATVAYNGYGASVYVNLNCQDVRSFEFQDEKLKYVYHQFGSSPQFSVTPIGTTTNRGQFLKDFIKEHGLKASWTSLENMILHKKAGLRELESFLP